MNAHQSLPALIALLAALTGASPTHAQVDPALLTPGEEMHSWVQELTSRGPRVPGTEASRKAAEFVHDKFSQAGLAQVAFEPARTLVWHSTHHALAVDGQALPASPMQHSFTQGKPTVFSTGPGGRTADMVYVGSGTSLDYLFTKVKGKVVVANVRFTKRSKQLLTPFLMGIQDTDRTFPSDYELVDPYSSNNFPNAYYRAIQGGAVGFVGVLADYFDSSAYRNEAYRAYRPGGEMSIPGLWMSPVAGGKLVSQIKASKKPLQATIELEGELKHEEGRGVVGYLPGQSDEIILIQSHHDSNTPGAVEDASGTSAVIGLAQYFAKIPESERKRTLMFATMDTHFTDYAVHVAFGKRHLLTNNPLGEKVVAVVTLEHIGREWVPGKDKVATPTGLQIPHALMVSTEIKGFREIALGAMKTHKLERTFAISTGLMTLVGGGMPADSSGFLQAGVPVIAFVGTPLYLYDDIDTADKVHPEDLANVTKAFADVVTRMSSLPSANFRRLPNHLKLAP